MPFSSKAQWRAAFSGRIKGFSRAKAHEWATKSPPFQELPEKVKKSALLESFSKEAEMMGMAGSPAQLGGLGSEATSPINDVVSSSHPIGSLPKNLTAPGAPRKFPKKMTPMTKSVMNPRRSLKQAMTVGLK